MLRRCCVILYRANKAQRHSQGFGVSTVRVTVKVVETSDQLQSGQQLVVGPKTQI
jgi:hypothetical protein